MSQDDFEAAYEWALELVGRVGGSGEQWNDEELLEELVKVMEVGRCGRRFVLGVGA